MAARLWCAEARRSVGAWREESALRCSKLELRIHFLLQVVCSRPKAQTPEQRRRNAKFAKDQDARRGKSESDLKKRTKDVAKSPISPFWLLILGFVVFGGLIFEVISRIFFR
ncbi:hypothetical protein F4780DRAFT_775748 [Xylariomycetidae sp. FL0641]|nr:hypothetical protein F4780DRAFT_775748 [Xylariomycetidae sp. FL0641]